MVGSQELIDPKGNIFAMPDATITTRDPVTVVIEARFVPLGTRIKLRVASVNGPPVTVESTKLKGTFEQSTATADITFPAGDSHVTLLADF